MSLRTQKEALLTQLHAVVDEKIATAQAAIASAKESRDGETKSTAGDKYETGRAMMQIEMDRHEAQLGKALALKNELARVDLTKTYAKAEFGSLVATTQGTYLLAIGLGKVDAEGQTYFTVSLASPIGQLLQGKSTGDAVQFGGRTLVIEALV
ncbi:hypothetical protein SAMN05421823_105217 [Catalinimonas alkaloidigena]|uniref:3-oxoacyl-ACP synthase n=1 Tax=Catalinimonas alkaloidigena TaxID=1075417 RepID=A0A1G9J702_9BACT|nr:hypothetical protein [Catalinimonas alkaloidigena]SDL33025.1 hypothetical protein SAMN05421823_105217 [Catalinimonas alkaloidigena]